ncbi:MAG TPA: hypothetical protein DCP56_01770, partial [Spirochaetaceae bacterium]|nr:hypothetical protein [Spirochaetaceae bacterium]
MERPELDEEANRRAAYWLLLNAKEQGFFSYGLLSQTAWEQVVESQGAIEVESSEAKQVNRDSLRSGVAETEQLQAESSAVKVLKEHYHLLDARAMLVVALRYAPDIEAEAAAGRAERGR